MTGSGATSSAGSASEAKENGPVRYNREARANCLSWLLFSFVSSLLGRGMRSKDGLTADDLDPMLEEEHAAPIAEAFRALWAEESKLPKPSIRHALWEWKKGKMIAILILSFFAALGPIVPAFLLMYLIPWLEGRENPTSDAVPYEPLWRGIVYVLIIALVPVFSGICDAVATRMLIHIGIVARCSLNSAVYRKSLNLTAQAKAEATTGQIINLMSADTERVFQFPQHVVALVALPVQTVITLVLLFVNIGISTFGGLAVIILMMPINFALGAQYHSAFMDKTKWSDKRLKLMNELLAGIKVVKLNCYEAPLVAQINDARHHEEAAISKFMRAFAWIAVTFGVQPNLIFLGAIGVRIALGDSLDVKTIFITIALFEVLRNPLSLLGYILQHLSTAVVSTKRLETFLMRDELAPMEEDSKLKTGTVRVTGTFSWAQGDAAAAAEGGSSAASGSAPASKSKSAAGSASDADVEVGAGGDATATNKRRITLPNMSLKVAPGELTMVVGPVGSGKSSLLAAILGTIPAVGEESKAESRGTIAYVPQLAWIVNGTLRHNVVFGKPFDQDKYEATIHACALEADLAMLPAGDQTEIGERGINLSGGQKQRVSIARAMYAEADIYLFDDPLSAVDAHVGKTLFEDCINGALRGKTRILVTNQLVVIPDADNIVCLASDGHVAEQGKFAKLMKAGGPLATMYTESMGQHGGSESGTKSSDGEKKAKSDEIKPKAGVSTNADGAGASLVQAEGRTKGGVPWRTYWYYFKAMGGVPFFVFFFFIYTIAQGLRAVGDFELAYLAAGTFNSIIHQDLSINTQMGIFAITVAVWTLFQTWHHFTIYPAVMRGGHRVHANFLKQVSHAPMSFFDMTPLGRLVNRFSKDMGVVDLELPPNIWWNIMLSFAFLGIAVTIAVSAPWFLVSVPPMVVMYALVQRYYGRTSIELQRLDSISLSPVFSQFSEALDGADSIRAYKLGDRYDNMNAIKLDRNNEAYIALQLANQWLKIRLAVLGGLLNLVVGFIVVFTRDNDGFNVGLASLALTQAFGVTALMNTFVVISARLEQFMNSVDRIDEYTRMAIEAPSRIKDTEPEGVWPNKGAVEFKDVVLRYRDDLGDVLKKVSFSVKSREKLDVVGRSGSGKSSLMVALFRLVELRKGTISIDGVDLSKLGLDTARGAIAIIPQDPVLFSGTIRDNVDPLHERTDEEVQQAIDVAVLRELIDSLPEGVNTVVEEGGSNFSVGQRQLFCLARAVLRKAKILILDEATASVDADTDRKIQLAVRRHFKDCTTITIAHRLHTIMDADRILVMDKGKVAECDAPATLLRRDGSALAGLVDATGAATAEHLRRIAFGQAAVVSGSTAEGSREKASLSGESSSFSD